MASFLKGALSEKSPGSQLFVLILVFLFFLATGQTLALLAVELIFQLNFAQVGDLVNHPANYSTAPNKLLLIISSIFQFIGTAGFFSRMMIEPDFLKIKNPPNIASIFLACFAFIICIPLISYLTSINAKLKLPVQLESLEAWMKNSEDSIDKLVKYLMVLRHPGDLLVNLVMIALIPAVGEELLFRGCFQRIIIRISKNPHLGIFLAAMLFSALHLQFYGFLPRLFLGMLLGYLYYWSQSIWLSMSAHFLNNALAVLSTSLPVLNNKWTDSDSAQPFNAVYIVISALSVTLAMGAIYFLSKRKKQIINI